MCSMRGPGLKPMALAAMALTHPISPGRFTFVQAFAQPCPRGARLWQAAQPATPPLALAPQAQPTPQVPTSQALTLAQAQAPLPLTSCTGG